MDNNSIINRLKKYENIFDQFNLRKEEKTWVDIDVDYFN